VTRLGHPNEKVYAAQQNRLPGKPAYLWLWYADGKTMPEFSQYCDYIPPAYQCNFGSSLDDCKAQVQAYYQRAGDCYFVLEGKASRRREGLVAVYDLDPLPALSRRPVHRIEIVVDRLVLDEEKHRRLVDSLELALRVGKGTAGIATPEGDVVAVGAGCKVDVK